MGILISSVHPNDLEYWAKTEPPKYPSKSRMSCYITPESSRRQSAGWDLWLREDGSGILMIYDPKELSEPTKIELPANVNRKKK